MNNGLLNRTDRQAEYEASFENLWQNFRSMYKRLIEQYSTLDVGAKDERNKQLYVLKQLAKIDTCKKLNNALMGTGVIRDWNFAPEPYKSRLNDQDDIANIKKLSKPYCDVGIQNDLNDFKSVVEKFIQQATVRDDGAKVSKMLEDRDDKQRQMLDEIVQKSKNNNSVLFDEIRKQKKFDINALYRALEIKTDIQYEEQERLKEVIDKHKEVVNDGIQKIQNFSTSFEANLIEFVKGYKDSNKKDIQKKIVAMFKKYDYYISQITNDNAGYAVNAPQGVNQQNGQWQVDGALNNNGANEQGEQQQPVTFGDTSFINGAIAQKQIKNINEYMQQIKDIYSAVANVYLAQDNQRQQPFIECINIISNISGMGITAQELLTQLILPGIFVDKVKLVGPMGNDNNYYFNFAANNQATASIIDNIINNVIKSMFAVVQIYMNKYSAQKPTLQDIIIAGGDSRNVNNSKPIKGAEMFYQLMFIFVKDIQKQVNDNRDAVGNSQLKLYIPQTSKYAELYDFISGHNNQAELTADSFGQYVYLCNKIWNSASGDTANDKLNQRTYNILKDFSDVVMQNIVIHMNDEAGANNERQRFVDNITELIEEDNVNNRSTGTDYLQLDGDTSFVKKNTTVEELVAPFNKQVIIKKSFNDRYSRFLDIVRNLITNSGTNEDVAVSLVKIVYNAITSTSVSVGQGNGRKLQDIITPQVDNIKRNINNGVIRDDTANLFEQLVKDTYVSIDHNTLDITVENTLANIYDSLAIEDKERKLQYIVNLVFYNGTMFNAYNTQENIKKEFNLYMKDYIAHPEYKNTQTYPLFVFEQFRNFNQSIVYKLFNQQFLLKAGYQQIYLETMLTLIMNVQKWYHDKYVDSLFNKDIINYLIKCTNYQNDPIIGLYMRYMMAFQDNVNVNDTNELLSKWIPGVARQHYGNNGLYGRNEIIENILNIGINDNNLRQLPLKSRVLRLFQIVTIDRDNANVADINNISYININRDTTEAERLQYYDLVRFGAEQFYAQYEFMLDQATQRRWCLRELLADNNAVRAVFFDDRNQLNNIGSQIFFKYDSTKQQQLTNVWFQNGGDTYFINSTYEQYLQQGIYPNKIYIIDDNKVRLEEVIPGVNVSNGKYDCSKLVQQLKEIKGRIDYKDYAANDECYKFFQQQIDITYDSAIELVKLVFDMKLPIIEALDDLKGKLSNTKYQGSGLINMKYQDNNNDYEVLGKIFGKKYSVDVYNGQLVSGKEAIQQNCQSVKVKSANVTNYQQIQEMKDIDELNRFITDTFVPIFEKSDALPESIQQKINETPYLRDVVLSSQKIVNKSQQSIQVYDNVIQTPFTLSDILFDTQQEIELPDLPQVQRPNNVQQQGIGNAGVGGQGKYGGNSVNFINGFSIPRNVFTLDFVTLVREKKGDGFKDVLKNIAFAINSKTGAGQYDGNYDEMIKNATWNIDFVVANKSDIEKMIKIPEDIKQQIKDAQKANDQQRLGEITKMLTDRAALCLSCGMRINDYCFQNDNDKKLQSYINDILPLFNSCKTEIDKIKEIQKEANIVIDTSKVGTPISKFDDFAKNMNTTQIKNIVNDADDKNVNSAAVQQPQPQLPQPQSEQQAIQSMTKSNKSADAKNTYDELITSIYVDVGGIVKSGVYNQILNQIRIPASSSNIAKNALNGKTITQQDMQCLEDKIKLITHCIPILYTYIDSNKDKITDEQVIKDKPDMYYIYHLYNQCFIELQHATQLKTIFDNSNWVNKKTKTSIINKLNSEIHLKEYKQYSQLLNEKKQTLNTISNAIYNEKRAKQSEESDPFADINEREQNNQKYTHIDPKISQATIQRPNNEDVKESSDGVFEDVPFESPIVQPAPQQPVQKEQLQVLKQSIQQARQYTQQKVTELEQANQQIANLQQQLQQLQQVAAKAQQVNQSAPQQQQKSILKEQLQALKQSIQNIRWHKQQKVTELEQANQQIANLQQQLQQSQQQVARLQQAGQQTEDLQLVRQQITNLQQQLQQVQQQVIQAQQQQREVEYDVQRIRAKNVDDLYDKIVKTIYENNRQVDNANKVIIERECDLHTGWYQGNLSDIIFVEYNLATDKLTPCMWKYNNETTANNRVGHGKMGGENAMHLSTGGAIAMRVGGAGEDNIPEYNRIVTDMKMPQIRKQILEQTSSFYVYDRTTQKIVKANLSGYNDVFSSERILYLYNVNALTKSIAYNYTFDDKIRICTQLIVNNKAINDMKRLADYSDNKYVKSMAQSMLNIITNFLDTNLRYIFDRDDVKKDYNEFTGKFAQYNNTIILDLLTTNLQQSLMPNVPDDVGDDQNRQRQVVQQFLMPNTITRVYLFIMLRSRYLISQKVAEQFKPTQLQDQLFKDIYNMQQFYLNVTKSRFDDLNNEYINYQPTRNSLVDARLMFVRKTEDNNMVGIDHGYANGSMLRRIVQYTDPYRRTYDVNNAEQLWFANEDYKNTYYNQLVNGMGGQNNLMWALLDKAKYRLMDLAAPESKINAIIATLKNKFDAPANLTFDRIFGDVNIVDNNYITGIRFDLSNESIYGTTYAITTNRQGPFSYAAVAQSIQTYAGITEPAIVKAASPICLTMYSNRFDDANKYDNKQDSFNTYLDILNNTVLVKQKIRITDSNNDNDYNQESTTNLIFKLTGVQPINAISLISNNVSLPITTILSMYNSKFYNDNRNAGQSLMPNNVVETTRNNLIQLRNMVRAYMRDNNKLTLQGPYLRRTMLTDQMAEPYNRQ